MALLFVLCLLNQVPSVNAKVVGLLRGCGVPPSEHEDLDLDLLTLDPSLGNLSSSS